MRLLVTTAFLFLFLSIQSVFAGRFELHQNAQYPAQSILLDTQTGKMWKKNCFSEVKDGDCAIKAWANEMIVGISTTESEIWKAVETYNKANQVNQSK